MTCLQAFLPLISTSRMSLNVDDNFRVCHGDLLLLVQSYDECVYVRVYAPKDGVNHCLSCNLTCMHTHTRTRTHTHTHTHTCTHTHTYLPSSISTLSLQICPFPPRRGLRDYSKICDFPTRHRLAQWYPS